MVMGAGIPRATLCPLAGICLSPPQPLVLSHRGVLFPRHKECRGWERTVLPFCCPTVPHTQPCPHPRLVASSTIPGSSPCGSCSSPGPATPGAPPLPAGRERCQGQALWGAGDRGPQHWP